MKKGMSFLIGILFLMQMSVTAFASTINLSAIGWVSSTIDSVGVVGSSTSVAVDTDNKVHISYYDATNMSVKYAANTSGSWVTDTIASNNSYNPSLAVGPMNKVHMIYKTRVEWGDYKRSYLKYTTNISGSWTTTTLDMSIIGGISIAVDSDNKVHICEYDWELGRLWYFTNATGDWAKVDNASPTTNSIAVDSNDKVHISYYYDGTNGGFKYATNASGSWVATTVDSNVYVEYNSIKTDSNNKVHISYYDYTNHDLKYATNASDGWVTTTVDSNGDVGGYTSIALDSNNKVHISYYDATNGDLKYATNASGSWVTTTVDSNGDVGGYSSIAVDSNNKVHISYSDGTNGDLKYATNASSCTDNDSDGYAIEGGDCGVVDCNDSNPAVNPGATEINNNSIDDDCNPATPTVTTSGSGNNYPVPLFRASLSLNVNASSLGTGSLSYYYTRNRLYFVSTSITGITATGGIATITGAGKVNNVTGYTFTATITDGTPDAMGLEIKKSDGTVYYSAPSQNVSSGNYTVVGQ